MLVAAHVAEPAAVTIHGLTLRRLWATSAVVFALAGVGVGAIALVRSVSLRVTARLIAASAAVAAGLVGAVGGGLVLAVANGGPGTGNGVVGGAAALVLGLGGAALGGVTIFRSRTASRPRVTT